MSGLPIARSAQAEEDLVEIWLGIAPHNAPAADRLLDRIEARLRQLTAYPYSGPERADFPDGVRQVIAGNFLIFYRVEADAVLVLRVLDGRRNITADDVTGT